MKTNSLVKALNKAGYPVEVCKDVHKNTCYYCETQHRILSWYDQEGTAICVRSRSPSQVDDWQSDYVAGFYCDTIKEAVRYMGAL